MAISLPKDANRVTVIGGVSSADGTTVTTIYVDPTTHRMLVNSAGASGTVTSVSVATANGFAGTVANPTTTPAITLTTSVTGVLKGNGTAISAATSGTDYSAGTSALGTGILKSTTGTGALTIAVAGDFPTLNQNTSGTAAGLSSVLVPASGGTGVANNNSSTITISGNFGTTFTVSGTTSLTLPTSGTVTALGNTTTGTGSIVLATSPTLVTPVLGVASATTINKVTITTPATGSTITIIDGKTLTINKTMSFTAADDTGVYTLPTGTKTLVDTTVTTLSSLASIGTITTGVWNGTTIAVANGGTGQTSLTVHGVVIGNAGSAVNVTSAGSTGQALISNGASADPTFQAIPNPIMNVASTVFETAGRFTATATGTGTVTFGANGIQLNTGGTGTSSEKITWQIGGSNQQLFNGNPTFACTVQINSNPATIKGITFVGLGTPTVSGTDITMTDNHMGFKLIGNGSSTSLFATQGDGSTETASSALTTVATQDQLDLIMVVTSGTSANYYWRLNGGSLSAATNLATHAPSASTAVNVSTFAVSNQANANIYTHSIASATYSR